MERRKYIGVNYPYNKLKNPKKKLILLEYILMKKSFLRMFFLIIVVLFVVYQKYQSPNIVKNYQSSPLIDVASISAVPVVALPSYCHTDGVLPDPKCTPGSIDPNVTQDNIMQTICHAGYTKTVRPPASITNALKLQQMTLYRYTDTNPRDYEEDHLISLELGGAPSDSANLWPEPGSSPNPKDRIENLCHKKICDGVMLLSVAQQQIAKNWQTACQ